jgi:hypothetical protein
MDALLSDQRDAAKGPPRLRELWQELWEHRHAVYMAVKREEIDRRTNAVVMERNEESKVPPAALSLPRGLTCAG